MPRLKARILERTPADEGESCPSDNSIKGNGVAELESENLAVTSARRQARPSLRRNATSQEKRRPSQRNLPPRSSVSAMRQRLASHESGQVIIQLGQK